MVTAIHTPTEIFFFNYKINMCVQRKIEMQKKGTKSRGKFNQLFGQFSFLLIKIFFFHCYIVQNFAPSKLNLFFTILLFTW